MLMLQDVHDQTPVEESFEVRFEKYIEQIEQLKSAILD